MGLFEEEEDEMNAGGGVGGGARNSRRWTEIGNGMETKLDGNLRANQKLDVQENIKGEGGSE